MAKAIKKLRRTIEKQTQKDFIQMMEEAWAMPFKIRLKLSWMILKGKRHGKAAR